MTVTSKHFKFFFLNYIIYPFVCYTYENSEVFKKLENIIGIIYLFILSFSFIFKNSPRSLMKEFSRYTF